MGLIARYVADETDDGMPMVLDTEAGPLSQIVCRCRTDAIAEMVARALNNQGAVEILEEIAAWDYEDAPEDAWRKVALVKDYLATLGGGNGDR